MGEKQMYSTTKDLPKHKIDHLGIIATYPTGWIKEFNLVSWECDEPKYDIRDWDSTHTIATRGITLTEDEMEIIVKTYKLHKLQGKGEK